MPERHDSRTQEVRTRHLRSIGQPDVAEIEISHLGDHLGWMRRAGRAERTIHCRRDVMEQLAVFLGHDPADANLLELERWQGTHPTIQNSLWKTLLIRPYYKHLRDRGIRLDNPAALLPLPKKPRRLPRPIPEDRLLAAVAQAPPRLLPWLLLAGWSGMRAIEIAGLTRECFSRDASGYAWALVIGKGDVQPYVPIPEWVWAQIEPTLPASGPCCARERGTGPVTAQHVSHLCCKYLHQIGIPDTFHSFRHRVATTVLHDTKDVRMVQTLLGHADLGTLEVYTAVQMPEMGRAVNALPRPTSTFGTPGTSTGQD